MAHGHTGPATHWVINYTSVTLISIVSAFVLDLSLGNFHLRSVGSFPSVTFIAQGMICYGILRQGSCCYRVMAYGILVMGYCGAALQHTATLCSFGTFAWSLARGNLWLGSFAPSLGNFRLGTPPLSSIPSRPRTGCQVFCLGFFIPVL